MSSEKLRVIVKWEMGGEGLTWRWAGGLGSVEMC